MQVPAARSLQLTKDPPAAALGGLRHEVVAPHVVIVPPAAFDALGAADQAQLPGVAKLFRFGQQPQRTGASAKATGVGCCRAGPGARRARGGGRPAG